MPSTFLLPNLVIAGVTKSGTSSLYWYLVQHPEICGATNPQVNHFAPLRYGLPPEPLDAYERHFSQWSGERYRLEKSPTYFAGGHRLVDEIDRDPRGLVVLAVCPPAPLQPHRWSGGW